MLGYVIAVILLAATLSGQVTAVSDGDTLQVRVGNRVEKVRLLGVDCPEVAHGPNDPGQEPWGSRAAEFSKKMVLGKRVRIETDVQARDRYGRLLGYVFVGTSMLNEALVQQGHAVLLTYPPNVKYVERFTRAQQAAREAKRGIWSSDEPLPQSPYQYRHRENARPSPATSGDVFVNLNSRRFHEASCPNHDCQNCRPMKREQALKEGYKPAGDCH